MNKNILCFLLCVLCFSCKDQIDPTFCKGASSKFIDTIDRDFLSNHIVSVSSIFNNNLIKVTPYSYFDKSSYHFKGDTINYQLNELKQFSEKNQCEILNSLSVLSSQPRLEWINSGDKLVAAAIFKKRIKLNQQLNKIQNVEDIVWAWHSGLNTGGVTNNKFIVEFEDGRRVVDGKIMNEAADALENNNVYVWAVWAWNDEGTKIIKSSMEIPFIVEGYISLMNSEDLIGKWSLIEAIDVINNKEITDELSEFRTLNVEGICSSNSLNNSVMLNKSQLLIDRRNMEIKLSADYVLSNIRFKCNFFTGILKSDSQVIEVMYEIKN